MGKNVEYLAELNYMLACLSNGGGRHVHTLTMHTVTFWQAFKDLILELSSAKLELA